MTLWSDTCERHRDGVEMEKWLPTTECEDEGNAMSAWKMVPVEPTDEMVDAGNGENMTCVPTSYINDIWSAMLEVAPVLDFKPVAYVSGWYAGYPTFVPLNRAAVLPQGMALYSMPPDAQAIIEGLTRERDEALLIHQTDTGTESAVAKLQAEVERLHLYKNLADEYGLSVFPDLASLQTENLEQARLLGMSGEREAAHLAQIEALKQDAARYLDALTRISQVPPDTCTTAYDMRYIARKTVDAAVSKENAPA